ncbi:glycosyltransferase [Phytohabitans aurantiacus]|uniref:Glycosyl transferase n=1 Tax=Phytohabitans aurantiacus TaxID=3016789 RepID=A0ABQ5R022_9ACTN|nr:glycosyltransferase [Phytohabitans aurantiacus]GLI00159.1 glycosyl transferase [Phytohabitans aurantiacus]
MTRIAHFTDASFRGVNGIAASIRLLTGMLGRRGHETVVVTTGPLWKAPVGDGVISVPSMPTGMGDFRFALAPIRSMRDRVREWRPDVAHVHTPGPLGAAGLTVARQLGVPAVYTYHTDMHGYAEHYYIPTLIVRAGTALYGRHLRRGPRGRLLNTYDAIEEANARVFDAAHVIVAPTAGALRRCRMDGFADRVRVIATPASLPPAAMTGAEFRARHGIARDASVVLFVGRLSAEKGIKLLIEAFALVRQRVPAATLLLVGPSDGRLRLRRLLDRSGLAAHTVTTGALGGADVHAAYAASDVFAFPSATDTQGIVLHEASLAGVPIVMTDRLLHASHPLAGAMCLTEPAPEAFAASLAALLTAPAEARHRGQHGRSIAERSTSDRFVDETLEAYRDAVTSAAEGSR